MRQDDLPAFTLVTGAASGIGAAVMEALVGAGRRVLAVDRDERALHERAEALGGAVLARALDVCDEVRTREIVDDVEARLGPIDGLVNGAGIIALGNVGAAPGETLARVLAVNAGGIWSTARAVTPHMLRRKGGAIVTVSSNAGSTPRIGLGAYCASKAAATMLTQCLGLELAPHGIRCNVVSPGSTETPMLHTMLGAGSTAGLVRGNPESFRLGIPLGRVASPGDVAEVVVFLLSERARHVTLQDVRVDGGATF